LVFSTKPEVRSCRNVIKKRPIANRFPKELVRGRARKDTKRKKRIRKNASGPRIRLAINGLQTQRLHKTETRHPGEKGECKKKKPERLFNLKPQSRGKKGEGESFTDG